MPTLPQTLKQMETLLRQGQLKAARNGLSSLQSQFPTLREVYDLQLILERKEKSYPAVETVLQTLIGPAAPKLPGYIVACDRYRDAKDYQHALNVAEKALSEYAQIPEAHANYLALLVEMEEDIVFIQALVQASAFLSEETFEAHLSEVIGKFLTRLLGGRIEQAAVEHIAAALPVTSPAHGDTYAVLKSVAVIVSEIQRAINVIFVDVTKFEGQITHYNHFFGAVALPLLEMLEMNILPPQSTLVLPFCGPMADEAMEIVRAFKGEAVFIPQKVADYLSNTPELFGHPSKVTLPAYDVYWNFGQHAPSAAVHEARNALQRCARQQGLSLEKTGDTCAITFVDRSSKIDAYYIENKRSTGTMRRSIPNAEDLIAQLGDIPGASVTDVQFEGMPLVEKFALMQTTDIFIVQHGAALTATYWLPPGAIVIEILSKDLGLEPLGPGNGPAPSGSVRPAGQILAEQMGARYFQVVQDTAHAPVNATVLRRLCERCVARHGPHP